MADDRTHLHDDLVALTCALVRYESSAAHPDQIAAAMAHVRAEIAGSAALLEETEANGVPALVATLRDTRTPALLLNGHIDVIPAAPHQFVPQVRDGRIYGRATQDMKGGVAVLLRLFAELATWEPRPDVAIQIVSDEETGGEHGTARLLREGWRCGLFVAAEPTDLRICYQQKGMVMLRLRLDGVPAHGSRPWEGENALHALGAGLVRLQERFPAASDADWRTTATPTLAKTRNVALNRLPDSVLLSFDIRYVPEDDPAAVIDAVCACFPNAAVEQCAVAPPLATSPQTPAVQQLAAAYEQVMGTPPQHYREHFGSDARHYSHAGIPALCFGPTGAGLHSDEEWVESASLVRLYEVLRAYAQQM